jgi:multidrug efflux pump
MNIIDLAISRKRVFFFIVFLLTMAGAFTYANMTKEAFPEINFPYVLARVVDIGISPEDGERLIAKPLEKEFKTMDSLKSMDSRCYENYCFTILEFSVDADPEKALREAKDAVDRARVFLPTSAEEPEVDEISTAEFPVAIVNVYGSAPERALTKIVEDLQDVLETVPGVLEADVGGKRDEQIEILIDPARLDAYRLSVSLVTQFLSQTNVLVPAGNIETSRGSFPIKVPGLIETVEDVMNLPIKADGDAVVKLMDIADVRRNYKRAEEYVRMNLRPALSLEIKKRVGGNTIKVVDAVRVVLDRAARLLPDNVLVAIANDNSKRIRENLVDLQNNVISAVLLVVVCVMLMLGARAGFLVGISIPFSFLLGILFIALTGSNINNWVLFGLIMSVGMLVDGAIVVTEYADQKMAEGKSRRRSFVEAGSRMAMVVIMSTVTTLMSFAPMLFWPGIMGKFMRYLPLTVLCVLTASLVVALLVVPIIGAIMGEKKPSHHAAAGADEKSQILSAAHGEYDRLTGYMRWYYKVLDWALARPGKVMLGMVALLFLSFKIYGWFGVGVELFPSSEPDFININVHARGNLSIEEKSRFIGEVERRVFDMPYFKNVYSRTGAKSMSASEDTVGYIQVELRDWQDRPVADSIIAEMGRVLEPVSGVQVEILKQRKGPVSGKAIEVEISASADDRKKIEAGFRHVRDAMDKIGGFANVDDTMPLPGIEWTMEINKAQAAKLGVSVSSIGGIVQMLTNGARVGSYMPADLDSEIYIVVRFPEKYRSLDMIDNLYVVTSAGASVPISSFVKIVPGPKVNMIQRIDGRRVVRIMADAAPGQFPAAKVAQLKEYIASNPLPGDVGVKFGGEDEDGRENTRFLAFAFVVAVSMMFLALLAQFNSFYSVFMILFSIILSTIGVLLGLVLTRDPFSIVMSGLAVVALAGVVINNNLILIDAYNEIKGSVPDHVDALKRTGLQRLRPVYLTAVTTLLGLVPMALKVNIDFVNATVSVGAPSMGMWAAFSRSIIFGLGFATVLTLVITPCMILLGERGRARFRRWRASRRHGQAARPQPHAGYAAPAGPTAPQDRS